MKKEDVLTMKQEISGFGGGYEKCCRNMLLSGITWMDNNTKAELKFRGYKNIYGIIEEDNDDAKALSKAVIDGSGGNCTGAMHQAVISSCLYIKKHGIEKYLAEMNK